MNYSNSDISDSGNLTGYRKLENVPYIIYNFPKILLWDNESQVFTKFNESTPLYMRDLYSIFIININNVREIFQKIMLEDYFT